MNDSIHLSWTCDEHTSSGAYATRFEGPTGQMLLNRQAEIVTQFAQPIHNSSILEVGAGHAQLASPLIYEGSIYSAFGSSEKAFSQLQKLEKSINLPINYQTGSLEHFPFEDQSFDTVISVRSMAHVPNWEIFLLELMRVAKEKVIIDFTPKQNPRIQKLMLRLKSKAEIGTRDYTMHSLEEIQNFIKNTPFRLIRVENEFILPMVMHRIFHKPIFYGVEHIFQKLKLTQKIGAPTIALLERKS